MNFKHIHFIINPAAGKNEAILSFIYKAFEGSGIEWDVSVTKGEGDAARLAKSLIGKTDLIAVYGGDGSICNVACALCGTEMPMAIIPGGTANVMAKELRIPIDTENALQLLKGGKGALKAIDMGMVNERPFLLRINLGIMADMVIQTDPVLKENFGQIAYGLSGLKSFAGAQAVNYDLEIDGEHIKERGFSLTVTNCGNSGLSDLALVPDIAVTDGLLDVLLLTEADLTSFLKVAGGTLMQMETDAIKHWKCKEVVVKLEKEMPCLFDDFQTTARELRIRAIPASVLIVTPVETPAN